MRILGINALFHDPAAALVVDGRVTAAAEEERFNRRKYGKRLLPWTYSFDPARARPAHEPGLHDPWDPLCQEYTSGAPELFAGPLPSPRRERIPAVVHVDGTARVQTVEERQEPLVARMPAAFERRTGLPVVVNTSLDTAGRPMADDPRDALEFFASAPVDLLAIGPYAVRRGRAYA